MIIDANGIEKLTILKVHPDPDALTVIFPYAYNISR